MKSLDEFYEHAKAAAAKEFDREGEHVATFVLDTLDGIMVIPAPWRNHAEKEVSILAVKSIAKTVQAVRAIVITEGWMAVRPLGSDTSEMIPSREPDRVEVLWLVGQSANPAEKPRAGLFPIERTSPTEARVGAFQPQDDGMSSSIFDGIVGGGVLQ